MEDDKQPPAPDQDLESNWIFQGASSCCQFVRIEHRMSMYLKGSLMGLVYIKAELLKMIQGV